MPQFNLILTMTVLWDVLVFVKYFDWRFDYDLRPEGLKNKRVRMKVKRERKKEKEKGETNFLGDRSLWNSRARND